jgi:hypothetical protein
VEVEAGLLVEVEVEELVSKEEQVVPLQELEFMGADHQDHLGFQDQQQVEDLVVRVV